MTKSTRSAEAQAIDVSVVIVHHETPLELRRCLLALAASREVSIEAFLIDNASRNFEPESFARLSPRLAITCNGANVGFATASNQGLRRAGGRYLLLLNPDTTVEPDTLATMVRYMDAHPDVGCSTARLVLPNGRLDLACRRSFPTPVRAFYRLTLLSRLFPRSRRFGQYNLTYLDERQEAEIDAPCGAFMMVRRQVIESVGLLDERYFMYGEDLDWAYRIKRAGWRIMYTPSATVRHVKRAGSRRARRRTIGAFYEAMRIFYREHYENSYPRWLSAIIYRSIDLREAIELAASHFERRGAAS